MDAFVNTGRLVESNLPSSLFRANFQFANHVPSERLGCSSPVLDCLVGIEIQDTMITVSKEDYLKAIAEAEAEGQDVIPATLAHWLAVTRPAVTFALKRLSRDGLVSVKNDGRVHLTSQGRAVAERTIVRHHLVERMLSEIFGMKWYEVHDEAERLEHAVSPAFEEKLVDKLGHQPTCPHGNGLALRSPAERRKHGGSFEE
jgi:DtxR family Mn-dependent transcriptional regulator